MSRKTDFKAALIRSVSELKGAHLTRETRENTMHLFAERMFELGFVHLASAKDINGKHLKSYIEYRKGEGIAIRTMQNEMSHLRSILRHVDRHSVANAVELKNAKLGIAGGSRIGKKTAILDSEVDAVLARAARLKRPGLGMCILLDRYLGLRGNEALHARLDTLRRWEKELKAGNVIKVVEGTKGRRPRHVVLADTETAKKIVAQAIEIAESQNGFLITRKNGKAAGGLKQARSIYHGWFSRAGIQPHSARYAFAQAQHADNLHNEFSVRESLLQVSRDLGHGSGRGRWVKSVYMR